MHLEQLRALLGAFTPNWVNKLGESLYLFNKVQRVRKNEVESELEGSECKKQNQRHREGEEVPEQVGDKRRENNKGSIYLLPQVFVSPHLSVYEMLVGC